MVKTIASLFLICIFVFFQSIQTYAQVIHETKYGDTLTQIANQYNTKPETIAKLNG
ncbi:LysM peptidoglycan-binding domain-containing protein [Neobacillus sp. SAB-20_R2A]|uniref:LysM peptidoglycan-binding domain-containing protein n=1 Tax=Neobacillus sp. SAB-20_R2A TaxID=3120519 RepID=UPI003C6DCC16